MAKRKRLTAPDAAELQELEAGFAAKPGMGPLETKSMAPPIAQVAGEAATLSGMANVTDRVALARDQGDAVRWREASAAGLVAQEIALDEIDTSFLRRDRLVEDEEAMAELVASLRNGGQRTPIEVVRLEDGYGLISGFRRVQAFRRLAAQDPQFARIAAFVRDAGAGQGAYLAMVEENELRANLTHYERGRIAVLAAGQGVFPSVEAAVDALFSTASKAKRSKVRSFAAVHEGLGDLLRFPTALTEKAGLRLAAALREGAQARLREALDGAGAEDARAEWQALERALKEDPPTDRDPARGGRPQHVERISERVYASGLAASAEVAPNEIRLTLKGRNLDAETASRLMDLLARELG
ncbi:chromosome partitioning protein, ParB family [Cribrihabitans marinus]|uniref:Chromosome partitioning protein, ParB family n=1 Tax=Cribrihabitans marinus TaxID=1227549 RepID=A0A1H7E0F7_9RHOB|nr:ParB/RepB/Spo0J family partition protein [Cribrihabitans marinus]GGH41185.1 chromosome partitioning protein ParB [Cribrihabitans marinus]SEK07308.1 chromosome partitioning protein, ParB family [Cribrihabitans marinus]